MPVTAAAAVGAALALDAAAEEFPGRVHPVALFGRIVGSLDREWSRPRLVGTVLALVLPVTAGIVVGGSIAAALAVDPLAGGAVAALWLFSTTSLRMLVSVGRDVIEGSATDPETARERVRALVGRDASELSPPQLRSAAIESVAENLVDGLVAPISAFALVVPVSLPVAVGAAAWVKAVNTLDSMLGYRSKPLGWASARLDDAVAWVPARVGSCLVAVAGLDPLAVVRARRFAREPSSPNSGWPMATLAVVLDVRLEKTGAYVLNADAGDPTVADGRRALRVVAAAGVLAFALAGVVAWF